VIKSVLLIKCGSGCICNSNSNMHSRYIKIISSLDKIHLLILGSLNLSIEGIKVLWNVGNHKPYDTGSYPRRLEFSSKPIWETQIIYFLLLWLVLLMLKCVKLSWMFRRVRKFSKRTVSFVMSISLSSRPHGTTRLLLDGFLWNLIFEDFSNTCKESLKFFKIRQEELYTFLIISRRIPLGMRFFFRQNL